MWLPVQDCWPSDSVGWHATPSVYWVEGHWEQAPLASHATHAWATVALQHWPPLHIPLEHWMSLEHASPAGMVGTQSDPATYRPGVHEVQSPVPEQLAQLGTTPAQHALPLHQPLKHSESAEHQPPAGSSGKQWVPDSP